MGWVRQVASQSGVRNRATRILHAQALGFQNAIKRIYFVGYKKIVPVPACQKHMLNKAINLTLRTRFLNLIFLLTGII